MSTITHTDAGQAVILNRNLAVLQDDKWGTNGSVALGLLLDGNSKPNCFCLFWEWGGDWAGFGDDDRHDAEKLSGWEPDAIREAVAEAVKLCPECEEDMDWFLAWADDAESALASKDAEE